MTVSSDATFNAEVDIPGQDLLLDTADRDPGPLVAEDYGIRDRVVRRSLAAGDLLAIGLALGLSATLSPNPISLGNFALFAGALLPVWIVLFKNYGLYDREMAKINVRTLDDAPAVFHAVLVGTILMWLMSKLLLVEDLQALELTWFGIAALPLVLILRWGVRQGVVRRLGPERVLIVGDPRNTNLRSKLDAHPEYGVVSVRGLDDLPKAVIAGVRELGELRDMGMRESESIITVAHQAGAERLIISDAVIDPDGLAELLRACKRERLKASLLPHVFDVLGPAVELDNVEGVTVIGIKPPVLPRSSRFLKRGVDICGSIASLILTAPLMAVIAVLIKLDSSGPVIFQQERIGRGGRRFKVAKFRTMVPDAESRHEALRAESSSSQWLDIENDPRVTRLGRILRLTSLDELPQFWNVLKGEMSIVGPRPLSVTDDGQVGGWARNRLDLAPGMTGLWQVLGRTDIPFDEMVKLDYLYITNWSLWTDARIIADTLPVLVTRRGAN